MYDLYIEDAYHLANSGIQAKEDRERKRYFRASIFYSVSAVEAFINYVGDTLSKSNDFPSYEIAFLTDRRFDVVDGQFAILDVPKYQRLEDKIRFLLNKFVPTYDFSDAPWCDFIEFKKFRDVLVHPRDSDDTISTSEYERRLRSGIEATLSLIDCLCLGIFGKNLRKGLRELSLEA
jgi:hypothetical protein